jgi:valyl-tRNA synthetase
MSSAQDVRFNEERVKQGRDLANKLWNASRLILLRVSDVEPSADSTVLEDRWIVSRLERLTQRVTEQFDGFRFSHAALDLYGAFWSELCDWYLELAKPRLYEDDNEQVSAVLLWALERTLRLLHAVMPFVTEEIWSLLPGERGLLAAADWPIADESRIDDAAEDQVGQMIDLITGVRRFREELAAKPSALLRGRFTAAGSEWMTAHIGRLARVEVTEDASDGHVLATVLGRLQLMPSADFDLEEAERQLAAKRELLTAEIERAEQKLANQKFVERAPADVVDEERRKLDDFRETLRSLG